MQTENEYYLTNQIITYLGNKRSLLDFIGTALTDVKNQLHKDKLSIFDVFSGSGIVSRYFKQHANLIIANDLETYSNIINTCYLSNSTERNEKQLQEIYAFLTNSLHEAEKTNSWHTGIISENYSPKDDTHIEKNERVFYTTRNAHYLDTARNLIKKLPQNTQAFFIAPLLSLASVHTNTSGVFKGFYKNKDTGLGEFGGKGKNALSRIMANMELPYPIFSNFDCDTKILQGDANSIIKAVPEVDIAYIDPPYNQHPYGSNYFMLNIIANNKMSEKISNVSGISTDWNRSAYNYTKTAANTLEDLVRRIQAKFVLISFNSEGIITLEEMKEILSQYGKLTIFESNYNTFRGSRNLHNRAKHVVEYLFLLKKV